MIKSMFIFFLLSVINCGGSGNNPQPPYPIDNGFLRIKSTIVKNCGGCHNGKWRRQWTPANFRYSEAASKIKSGAMPPPPRTLTEDDRDLLLEYLEIEGVDN